MEFHFTAQELSKIAPFYRGEVDSVVLHQQHRAVVVVHGSQDGTTADLGSYRPRPDDLVICCYPKQVAAAHPEWNVLFPNHGGQIHSKAWMYKSSMQGVLDVSP